MLEALGARVRELENMKKAAAARSIAAHSTAEDN